MRLALPLLLIVSAVLPAGLLAGDSLQVDPAKRDTQLSPTPESADTPLSPNRETNQRTFWRNDHVQDQRFSAPDKIERKDAVMGDKRASIDVTETREKNMIDHKEFSTPELREREINRHDGEKSFIQPEGDQVRKFDTVTKFQGRMTDADNTEFRRQPKLEKKLSFDKLNRFVFRRNGPGSESGQATVTPAASEAPPPSQDTHTTFKVKEWLRLESTQ
ncbi:MAG: hypothetical protein WC205_07580 [Opitutaceae bacterium]|jgi:hypothetical protein